MLVKRQRALQAGHIGDDFRRAIWIQMPLLSLGSLLSSACGLWYLRGSGARWGEAIHGEGGALTSWQKDRSEVAMVEGKAQLDNGGVAIVE